MHSVRSLHIGKIQQIQQFCAGFGAEEPLAHGADSIDIHFVLKRVDEKVQEIMDRFPISTKNLIVSNPRITLQTDDGAGFSVTIIQGRLRTK